MFIAPEESILCHTELIGRVISAPVAGSLDLTDTTQAPHPPSRHEYLVPLSPASSRM